MTLERSKQTKGDKTIRDSLLCDLENIIKEKYDDVQLHLFGSSNNGFCMKKSDLDICLTLKRCPTGEVGCFFLSALYAQSTLTLESTYHVSN